VSTIPVPAAPAAYDVWIEPGALAELPARLDRDVAAAGYAIIADERVAGTLGAKLRAALAARGRPVTLHTHPSGEQAKTRATWAALTDALLASGLGRDGCVIALGGGVTGDLAGFVAATYMRGVAFVQVPTTLLAMVDAAVGGKTGVDTGAGKNLVGAFHAPRLVCSDPLVLRTLPDPVLRAGLAEVVKHGAIADAGYLAATVRDAARLLAREPEALGTAIARSVEIKARVVAADPRERGERATLNFGHTLAHALEREQRFQLAHGYAVAIGMAAAARIGEHAGVSEPGTAASLAAALAALELPTRLPRGTPLDALLDAARLDKKARAGRTRYVLLHRPGAVARNGAEWTFEVSDAAVRDALAAGADDVA
jgi:3-dehydroquinate synthase